MNKSRAKKSSRKLKRRKTSEEKIRVPAMHDWRTSDEDEVNRRRLRGREESFQIRNLFPKRRVYSNFEVISSSGMTYEVEVRDLVERRH